MIIFLGEFSIKYVNFSEILKHKYTCLHNTLKVLDSKQQTVHIFIEPTV